MKFVHIVLAVVFPLAATALRGSGGSQRNLQASSITKLALINADNDQVIESVILVNGATISLSNLPTSNLNIQAVTQGTLSSVQFSYSGSGGSLSRREGASPYALCGDSGGNYNACSELVVGSHTVTAIAFSG